MAGLLVGHYKYIELVKPRGHCRYVMKMAAGDLLSFSYLVNCRVQWCVLNDGATLTARLKVSFKRDIKY